ncbi:hypothetical protein BCV70DRAFT_49029 [Testicularia cyperi]|uniref:Uncharacterized protein n=1 Tax=Testicularia cyperi TaxID=1882483 RepID=A0A317XGR7_9BASI|nr:hypothetical protein BCV70DRAFT_49029 [Testicularia cyperi]
MWPDVERRGLRPRLPRISSPLAPLARAVSIAVVPALRAFRGAPPILLLARIPSMHMLPASHRVLGSSSSEPMKRWRSCVVHARWHCTVQYCIPVLPMGWGYCAHLVCLPGLCFTAVLDGSMPSVRSSQERRKVTVAEVRHSTCNSESQPWAPCLWSIHISASRPKSHLSGLRACPGAGPLCFVQLG